MISATDEAPYFASNDLLPSLVGHLKASPKATLQKAKTTIKLGSISETIQFGSNDQYCISTESSREPLKGIPFMCREISEV